MPYSSYENTFRRSEQAGRPLSRKRPHKRYAISGPFSSFVVVPAGHHDLLVAEGFYGIEAGGFYGRVHAEEEADAHGDADSNHDGPEWDGGRQTRHYKMDDQADGAAEQYADDATQRR